MIFVHTSNSRNAKKRAAENFAAPQLPTISITFRVMIMGREASWWKGADTRARES